MATGAALADAGRTLRLKGALVEDARGFLTVEVPFVPTVEAPDLTPLVVEDEGAVRTLLAPLADPATEGGRAIVEPPVVERVLAGLAGGRLEAADPTARRAAVPTGAVPVVDEGPVDDLAMRPVADPVITGPRDGRPPEMDEREACPGRVVVDPVVVEGLGGPPAVEDESDERRGAREVEVVGAVDETTLRRGAFTPVVEDESEVFLSPGFAVPAAAGLVVAVATEGTGGGATSSAAGACE